jgi:hypothetical protein
MGHKQDAITLGYKRDYGAGKSVTYPVTLPYADRDRHCYILGKTRMGKSSLLETMVVQDIANGHGVAFIDPHGKSAETLLDYIPSHRVRDVVYLNPNDLDFPIGFNPFHNVPPHKRHLVADNLVLSFKHFWRDSWGARLEYILDNTLRTELCLENGSFVHAYRLLTDARSCKRMLGQTKLPKMFRDFWELEMPSRERERREWVMPVVNKLGPLIKSEPLANIVCQTRNTLKFSELMDNRRILIVNLSSRELGLHKRKILGSMLISHLLITAMARLIDPDRPPSPYYLYIDEFQYFLTDAIDEIVSEAGKFGLCLTLAHQYTKQLSEEIRAAILGNVGTTLAFKVGGEDASLLEHEFGARSQQEFGVRQDFLKLQQHQVCAKLPDDYVTTFWTNPSLWQEGSAYRRSGHGKEIINWSRHAYGKPRAQVEAEIAQLWGDSLGDAETTAVAPSPTRVRRVARSPAA